MPLEDAQREWLSAFSGLKLAQQQYEERNTQKQVLVAQMSVNLESVKARLREQFTKSLKTGVFSKVKTLEEEGGQLDEFDLDDLQKVKKRLGAEYVQELYSALDSVDKLLGPIRAATYEEVDPKTGKTRKVPLFSDEEIMDEIYFPLVRERIMPEWLVADRFSKTQQMIDATDKLYQARLKEYTDSLEEEEQGFLDACKNGVTGIGKVAQGVVDLVPGLSESKEMANAVIGVISLGTTTMITVGQRLSDRKIDGSVLSIIDNFGTITGEVLALATGNETAKLAVTTAVSAASTFAKAGTHLKMDPPSIDGALDALATGIQETLSKELFAALGVANSEMVSKIASTSASAFFSQAARGVRIEQHISNGDSDALIAELNAAAKGAVETVGTIVTEGVKDGAPEDIASKLQEKSDEITERISQGIDLTTLGISTGKKITDAVKAKSIQGMAEDIVDGIGGVLSGVVSQVAGADSNLAGTIAAAYQSSTKVGLVSYYLSMDPPETSKAMSTLGDSLSGAVAMIAPENEAVQKASDAIGSTFSTVSSGIDFAKAIREDRYGDAVAAISACGNEILSKALDVTLEIEPGAEDVVNEIATTAEIGDTAFSEIAGEIAGFKDTLKDQELAADLERRVNELRTAQVLAEVESTSEEIERLLVQVDEGGEAAADVRSIENLIKQMQRDRMIMEMATKIMGAGAGGGKALAAQGAKQLSGFKLPRSPALWWARWEWPSPPSSWPST